VEDGKANIGLREVKLWKGGGLKRKKGSIKGI